MTHLYAVPVLTDLVLQVDARSRRLLMEALEALMVERSTGAADFRSDAERFPPDSTWHSVLIDAARDLERDVEALAWLSGQAVSGR